MASKKSTSKKTRTKRKPSPRSAAGRGAPIKFDRAAKDRFIAVYEKRATWQHASDAAGIAATTARHHYNNDEEWRAEVDAARERFINMLENEATRRACEGDVETRLDKDGNIVSTKTVYSDRLMELMLKRWRKAEHAAVVEQKVEQTVKEEPSVDLSKLDKDEKIALRELLKKAGAGDDES